MPQESVEELAQIVLTDRPDAFLELMARVLSIPPEHLPQLRRRLEEMHQDLRQTFVAQLEQILKDKHLDSVLLSESEVDHNNNADTKQRFLDELLETPPAPPCPVPLTPQLRQWARGLYTEAEIVAGLQAARQHNGPDLNEAIQKIEQELRASERANQ